MGYLDTSGGRAAGNPSPWRAAAMITIRAALEHAMRQTNCADRVCLRKITETLEDHGFSCDTEDARGIPLELTFKRRQTQTDVCGGG